MRFISIVIIPILIILTTYHYFEGLQNNEIFNTFIGIIVGSLLSFYVTSTFEGLKYRISEKNNWLRSLSKTDFILNNNLKNLIHTFGAFGYFEENLDKPKLQELQIYSFTTNTEDFLTIGDIGLMKKIVDCLVYFEHLQNNLMSLKNFHLKYNIDLEKAIRNYDADHVYTLIHEFSIKSASLRLIIKSSFQETYKASVETIALLQANSKRIRLSNMERLFFGNITKIYTKNLNEDYLKKRRDSLMDTYKLI